MIGTLTAWLANLRDPACRAAFAVGFCILFAFIGTFTYVNFVLVRQPFALGMMGLGFVYFVFLPSVVSTPIAGQVALRCGTRVTCAAALRSPRWGCRCCCCRPYRRSCWAWCCSASARSSPRRLPRALSAAQHTQTVRRLAACISPAISWAVSWVAWC